MKVNDLFVKLLGFRSITPDDAGSLNFVREYLPEYEAVWKNEGGVKNLFLYRWFGDGIHLMFAGHVDVVPPGDGWQSDPFVPMVKDGIVTARGAQDMKSGVAAFVQALKETKDFNGTLSLLLTSDEEGDGKFGTQIMLEHLKSIGMLPEYAIVAEPTCDRIFGDSIKIGRRGSINGTIELVGRQGHAAYPEKSLNPIHQIAKILPQIAGINLDEGDSHFAPSKFVVTDIRAGMEVTNVTPGKLKMMFNVRNSTKTSIEDIEKRIKGLFNGLEFQLQLSQSAKPFLTDSESLVVQKISQAIESVCAVKPAYSTTGGTSDARFLAQFGVPCVEFGVINDTIHARNEHTSMVEVEKLYKVFCQTIKIFEELS